jgi:hypothetical protein
MSKLRNTEYHAKPRTKRISIVRYKGTDAGFHSPKMTEQVREWRNAQP